MKDDSGSNLWAQINIQKTISEAYCVHIAKPHHCFLLEAYELSSLKFLAWFALLGVNVLLCMTFNHVRKPLVESTIVHTTIAPASLPCLNCWETFRVCSQQDCCDNSASLFCSIPYSLAKGYSWRPQLMITIRCV